jgi:hypothetical protein
MNPEEKLALAREAFEKRAYAKNIFYRFDPSADFRELEFYRKMAGTPGESNWIIQQCYRRHGVQIQVQKDVSDDLMETDFALGSKLEDVPWPAQVVEVYFEDPKLPTLLVMKAAPGDVEKMLPGSIVEIRQKEYLTALMQEGNGDLNHSFLSLQLHPDLYDNFITNGEAQTMDGMAAMNTALQDADSATLSVMLQLVMKVFVFASIPNYRPNEITRKQMHFGGKPDVKGRPHRKSLRILYAPNIISDRKINGPSGIVRSFKGRRGHLHYYRDERFVNRRGTWDYFPRIYGSGDMEKTVIKVRKPS